MVSGLFDAMRNTLDSNAIAAELAEFTFDVGEVDALFQKVWIFAYFCLFLYILSIFEFQNYWC